MATQSEQTKFVRKEIKRKYLVDKIKDFNKIVDLSQDNKLLIKQCYLKNAKDLVIRLRLQNSINEEKAFIKIKGKTIGRTELEYEYEIPSKIRKGYPFLFQH